MSKIQAILSLGRDGSLYTIWNDMYRCAGHLYCKKKKYAMLLYKMGGNNADSNFMESFNL